jgi:general secretion pathway protein N
MARNSSFRASTFGSPNFRRGRFARVIKPVPTPTYKRWALMGAVLGTLGALGLYAPAAWLAAGVAQASGGQVLLADARGTVWHGSAQLVLTGGAQSNDATALPERMIWSLWPSFSGLRGSVLPVCCSTQSTELTASASLSGAKLQIGALQMNLPAELLSGLGTPWNTLNPQGHLALTSPALTVEWRNGSAQLDGSATLDMTDVSSRLSTLRPLGDYRLSLTGGAAPSLQLQTLQGALQLSGSGQWVGSRMRFSGEASAAPEREAALTNLLNIIGRRQGAKSLITLG